MRTKCIINLPGCLHFFIKAIASSKFKISENPAAIPNVMIIITERKKK